MKPLMYFCKLTAEQEFDVDVNFTGTPQFRVFGDSVNFFERFSITHRTAAGNVEPNIFSKSRHWLGMVPRYGCSGLVHDWKMEMVVAKWICTKLHKPP